MKKLFKNKKFLIGLAIVIIAIALTIGGMLYFSPKSQNNDNNVSDKVEEQTNKTILVISINPKLMLWLNDDGKIIDIDQLNDDAKIFTNTDLKDLDLDSAIEKIVAIATANGYFKKTDDKKLTLFMLDNGDSKYLEQAKNKFETKGIKVDETEATEEEQAAISEKVEKKNSNNNNSNNSNKNNSSTNNSSSNNNNASGTPNQNTSKIPSDYSDSIGVPLPKTTLQAMGYYADYIGCKALGFRDNKTTKEIAVNKILQYHGMTLDSVWQEERKILKEGTGECKEVQVEGGTNLQCTPEEYTIIPSQTVRQALNGDYTKIKDFTVHDVNDMKDVHYPYYRVILGEQHTLVHCLWQSGDVLYETYIPTAGIISEKYEWFQDELTTERRYISAADALLNPPKWAKK